MTKKQPKAAYVVFRGKKPGVYYTWPECQAQVVGFPKGLQRGYTTGSEAQEAWDEWTRKATYKLESNPMPVASNTSRFWAESIHPPSFWVEPTAPPPRQNSSQPAMHSSSHWAGPSASPWQTSPQMSKRTANVIDLTNDSDTEQPVAKPIRGQYIGGEAMAKSSNMLDGLFEPGSRKSEFYHIDDEPPFKRFKSEYDGEGTDLKSFMSQRNNLEPNPEPYQRPLQPVQEKKIELSEEQEKVVKMSLRRDNIFLTGAAGCGKTITLKEIIRRLEKKKKKVQVVAPTGIAALPLGGKTTYSFAGWNPDFLKLPIDKLIKDKRKKGVLKAIQALDVLIIEEISMVENQFLERLNLLFQDAMSQAAVEPKNPYDIEKPAPNKLPFGGKQVIFLGDFHQLPPVKPFANCLQCGESIPQNKQPLCVSSGCRLMDQSFQWGDKWAFRAPVWRELRLRHVKLDQIHRQKDTRFQDILNKIRNGAMLDDAEWRDLERPKQLPRGAFAVRLMSRLGQVNAFNERELAALKFQPKTWVALDSSKKLIGGDQNDSQAVQYKLREYKESLKDHRFQQNLTLKVGARVVLLYNLNHDKGLVNGSQGVVVGFKPATAVLEQDVVGEQKEWRMQLIRDFQERCGETHHWRPLVRFANGVTELIPALASASIRGGSQTMDQYFACRTQIPLTLAWALSIHKSQGMTLEYVEVSSRDIFESGQLYVALSRATDLQGLNLTGFSRQQLPMDKDVLEFYASTKWEKLQPRKKRS